nr:peptidoglycan-binding domain-containing protein [Jiella mangrovi]
MLVTRKVQEPAPAENVASASSQAAQDAVRQPRSAALSQDRVAGAFARAAGEDASSAEATEKTASADRSGVPAPAPRPLPQPDPEQTASITAHQSGRVVPTPHAAARGHGAASSGRFASLSEAERVKRIQAALASAQVADLSVDGILGEKTKAAIRTFEALEGMDVTGKPDAKVLQRLAEIGLVQ